VAAPQVTELAALSEEQADLVLALRDTIRAADGASPLSDHVVSAIRGKPSGSHFLQLLDGRLVGYAHLETDGRGGVAELAVSRAGDPATLLETVGAAGGGSLRIWARGDAAPLNDVLPAFGFTPIRTLLQLRRRLDQPPLGEPAWPVGVDVRTFRVGADESAWLAVNNAAFTGHPEQSNWTVDDIRAREGEPWFDPAGFFLAERQGRLVGFHWTKQHDDELGEVYVIGVDPSMQGQRLGEALLLQGLRHLRDAGLVTALLYVESDNAGAVALYERLGFTRWDADRMFSRPG
jgi:mycothiol synthase